MVRLVAMLSLGLLTSSVALAADNGVYLGAAISQAKVDVNLNGGFSINDSNTKFKIIAGVRPLDWFAVEMNYVDFGATDKTIAGVPGEFKLKGVDAFAVGLFEVALVDLYGKVGVIRWDQSASLSNISIPSLNDSGFDPAYGAGVQVHFGSLSARAEYEQFDTGSAKAKLISVGLTWTFL